MPDRPETLGTHRQDLCLPLQPIACEATFFSPGAQPGMGIVKRGTSLPRPIGRIFSLCELRLPCLLDLLLIGSFAMWKVSAQPRQECRGSRRSYALAHWSARLIQAFRLTVYCSSNHTVMAPTKLMAVWWWGRRKIPFCPFSRGSVATPRLAALQE